MDQGPGTRDEESGITNQGALWPGTRESWGQGQGSPGARELEDLGPM